jgi:hypothetical protein
MIEIVVVGFENVSEIGRGRSRRNETESEKEEVEIEITKVIVKVVVIDVVHLRMLAVEIEEKMAGNDILLVITRTTIGKHHWKRKKE